MFRDAYAHTYPTEDNFLCLEDTLECLVRVPEARRMVPSNVISEAKVLLWFFTSGCHPISGMKYEE